MKCEKCGAKDPWADLTDDNTPYTCRACRDTSESESGPDTGTSGSAWTLHLVLFGLGTAGVVWVARKTGYVWQRESFWQLAYWGLWVFVLSGFLAHGYRKNKSRVILHGLAWIAVFALMATAYTIRGDLSGLGSRVLGNLMPHRAVKKTDNSMAFQRGADGHFHVLGEVNGRPVRFLVDTGASGVVLTPRDAESLGWKLEDLSFDRLFETANGRVRGASVVLEELRLGGVVFKGFPASVNEADMGESLLGMSFFNRLEGFAIRGDELVLTFPGPVSPD